MEWNRSCTAIIMDIIGNAVDIDDAGIVIALVHHGLPIHVIGIPVIVVGAANQQKAECGNGRQGAQDHSLSP
jgi:hypothetical protein